MRLAITLLQRFRKLLITKRLAVLEACFIGLVAALAAVLLKQVVGIVGGWRVQISYVLPAWLVLPGIGLGGGLIAGWLVERVAPETSGSGIPQVKAVLSRVPLVLDFRVAIVKLIGATIAIGSGMVLGREGPTIQVGAALAAELSRWFPTSPDYRRQLIAAGASAGLAAAFNTPITGVLFVAEALLQDVSGFTLGTGILAAFVGAVVSRQLGGSTLSLDLKAAIVPIQFSIQEIPLYLLLGALAGLLGGVLFNKGIIASLSLNRYILKLGLPWRMAIAGLISGIIIAVLPTEFRDSTGLRTILNNGGASWEFTAIAFIAHFVLTLVAYGSGAPGGLSAPSLVLGSALGYLVGTASHHFLHIGDPIAYSLAGMGAFFSAVSRTPITAVIIVFELTTDFNIVLPLMVVSAFAYLVAETFNSGSIYDHLLQWNNIKVEAEVSSNGLWTNLTAADVMQRQVETLTSLMTVDEAMAVFAQSHHRGFPVLEDGKLVGIVTQTDFAGLRQSQGSNSKQIAEIMTPQPITVSPEDKIAEVLYLLNRYNLSRLPVTEHYKLVGIITRSDIIRAESDSLTGNYAPSSPLAQPSYVVYRTCAPAIGRGRILVLVSNPNSATALLEMAAAIARDRHYEIECLHVIPVSRDRPPRESPVDTTTSRRLLRHTQKVAETWQVPIHTQARVAHDVAQAILETIKECRIDLMLMGWKGSTSTSGRILGNIADILIHQSTCQVMLVKLSEEITNKRSALTLDRWVVPIAGGPNAQQALHLLPALVALSKEPEIRLCQVFSPSDLEPNKQNLEKDTQFLNQKLSHRLSKQVIASSVYANSVPEAVLDLAYSYRADAIVIGASRQGILQQTLHGNIPEIIATNSKCTVILVRGNLE